MASTFQKIDPLKGSILIEPDVYADSTKEGIVILEESKDTPQSGTVIRTHKSSNFKEGDIVYFIKHAGKVVDEYLLMREDDILCIEGDNSNYPLPNKPGVVVEPIKEKKELIVLIDKKENYSCGIVLKDNTKEELIKVGSYVLYETKDGNPLPYSNYEYIVEPNIVAVSN